MPAAAPSRAAAPRRRRGINLEKSFVDLIIGLRDKNPNNFFEGTDVADNQLFQKVTSIESARLNVATEED